MSLADINKVLAASNYVVGYTPSHDDAALVKDLFGNNHSALAWAGRIASYYGSERNEMLKSEMSVRLSAVAGNPLRLALTALGKVCPSQPTVLDGPYFGVTLPNGQSFKGFSTAVRALHLAPQWVGASPEQRSQVFQWVTAAAHGMDAATVEERFNTTTPYIASTPQPSAADVTLYFVLADAVGSAPGTYVKLQQWLLHIEENVDAVKGLREKSVAALLMENGKGEVASKGSEAKFARPSEEEIKARRLEKERLKAEKEKAAGSDVKVAGKDKAPKGAAAVPVAPTPVTFNDLDVRVGTMLSVSRHPTADRLYMESIDVGEAEPRKIISGLVQYYKPEELVGAQCLVICNMKPKKLVGEPSNGMVLCAGGGDVPLELVRAPAGSAPGDRVFMKGTAPIPSPPIPSSAKMDEILKGLMTDANGIVVWNGTELVTPKGGFKTSVPNVPVK
jgi:aminoacyl tRNA synthase complex-interacting multifunctional protein 1